MIYQLENRGEGREVSSCGKDNHTHRLTCDMNNALFSIQFSNEWNGIAQQMIS